ncbi:hypothetical protein ABZP36_036262 [Zizania latifolia]
MVACILYNIIVPVSVMIPELFLPIWGVAYIPMALLVITAIRNPRNLHIMPLWILFENVMTLHRMRAALTGLLELSGFNQWIVTKKAGNNFEDNDPLLHKTKKRLRDRINFLEIGFSIGERLVSVDELLEADEVFCTGTAVIVSHAYAAAGTIKENYANILVLLLQFRQACDHPILLKGKRSDLIVTRSIKVANQLPKETVINLLGNLEGSYTICSICSDPPEDAVPTSLYTATAPPPSLGVRNGFSSVRSPLPSTVAAIRGGARWRFGRRRRAQAERKWCDPDVAGGLTAEEAVRRYVDELQRCLVDR